MDVAVIKTTMETTHIYALIDPRNDHIKYIGRTNNVRKRYWEHINDKRTNVNKKLVIPLLKHGLMPVSHVLDTVPTSEWEFWERHYISLYRSWGFELLNIHDGGINKTQPELVKRKIAIASRLAGSTVSYKNRINGTYEKSRQRMLTNNPMTKSNCEVFQYDLNGVFIKEWSSYGLASKELSISRSGIWHCLQKYPSTPKAGGFKWEWKNKPQDKV